MFSHRQHLNKHGVSHIPQSLILPVHSSHPQTQHEINSNVTRLHFPGAMRCAANSAYSNSKALHGNRIYPGFIISSEGRGWLGGSGNGMQCLLSPGERLKLSQVSSIYKAVTTPGLRRSQHETRISGFTPALGRPCQTCHSYTWHRRAAPKKALRTGLCNLHFLLCT